MKPITAVISGIVTGIVILLGPTVHAGASEDVESLIQRLTHADEDISEAAEQALVAVGSAAVEPVAHLLRDKDRAMQTAALRILENIGTPAAGALMRALTDTHWRVRMGAARALGTIKDQSAVDPLRNALRDEHQAVRATAATALGNIGNPNAIPALTAALKDNVAVVRASAVKGLGTIGSPQAIDALLQAIQEPGKVRRASIDALADIGPPAVGPMGERLTDQSGDPGVRVAIANAFERMRAEESVTLLSTALHDTDRSVRGAAANALVIIGPPAVASVREVLWNHPAPDVRALAAGILLEASRQANRPWAQEALAALIAALKDDDPSVRAASRMGIMRFKFQALEQLYVGLRENNPEFRIEIATTLEDIGHPLSIRHLEELLTTETHPDVRKAATAAIVTIKEADILAPK